MFAEGIAGRRYHIKAATERPDPTVAEADSDGRSLYLPETVDAAEDVALNAGVYRLLALEQLGFEEFGTYRFNMAEAGKRFPALATRDVEAGPRETDLGLFFAGFERPGVARRVFRIVETARVNAAVDRRYPGVRRYRRALGQEDGEALLAAGLAPLPARRPLLPLAVGALRPDADVYTTAAATVACCDALALDDAEAPAAESGPALEWLQRQARLAEWQGELDAVDSEAAAMAFAADQAQAAADAEEGPAEAGSIRDAATDLAAKRDRLKRRIDMERATVRHALGEDRAGESFRYDEWDCNAGRYRRGWCRLYQQRLQSQEDTDSAALLRAVRPHAQAVRRRFEHIRPAGYQRLKRTPDGDELDLDAIVASRADIRTGASPDERVYSRRERLRRDVAAALLVDLSASTDDIVPAERAPAVFPRSPAAQDIRDPYFDEDLDEDDAADFRARLAEDAAKRRVIDIQQEAVLLMATALEGLGDRYGVYGFSGYGREGVEFYVAKEFDDPLDQAALDAIAAMKPKRSTRMGPAVRHAAAKLAASGAALKVLMIVSDGFPQDHDYGPNRGDHEYGVQDTARALGEAQGQGIEPFCVTVDCAADAPADSHDYLRRMCPEHRYMVIAETDALAGALQKAYRRLTSLG